MEQPVPRGIAVVDAGSSNSKIALFGPDGQLLAERKAAALRHEGPPYRAIDPAPLLALCQEALPELDAVLPIDAVVPCGHGAALACLDDGGALALPLMAYTSEPPADIAAAYRKVQPPFGEVFSPLLPMALTHGLQLFWQQRCFAEDFTRVRTVLPWIQYVGFLLGGRLVTEISAMACQSHLMNIRHGGFSSLVRGMGWEKLFPPMAKAWESIGTLRGEFRGENFRGRGEVLAGVHDSTANYLRYLAGGQSKFTLLSTGTWIIGFDTEVRLESLASDKDTVTNTDVFGHPVGCCRFFGGHEFEILGGGTAGERATLAGVQALINGPTYALPSFSDGGGPVPHTGGRGRIVGIPPAGAEQRASLASLYCALMVAEQLDALNSRHDIIVDGPFSHNPVFLQVLAQLRPGQRLLASDLRDGTTAGAACLALMPDGKLPHVPLSLITIASQSLGNLAPYQKAWQKLAYENRPG